MASGTGQFFWIAVGTGIPDFPLLESPIIYVNKDIPLKRIAPGVLIRIRVAAGEKIPLDGTVRVGRGR
jgi:cation transport ATPase